MARTPRPSHRDAAFAQSLLVVWRDAEGAPTRSAPQINKYLETKANMKKEKKSCEFSDGIPIRVDSKPKKDLPLPLRELADLLAELAAKQLEQSQNPLKKEN
jgi:hypothetical protein